MTEQRREDMQRLHAVIDAYGSVPRRWPEGERAALKALLSESAEAQAALTMAAELDQALDNMAPPQASPELMANILYVPPKADWHQTLAQFWPFGALWKPASGLVLAAALSVFVALSVPLPGAEMDLVEEIETEILG